MTANADQEEYWSSPAGQAWAVHQQILDQLLSGVLDALMNHAAPMPGEYVLDIGCGTGASSLELAQKVKPEGQITAVDISEPLLALAKARAQAAGASNIICVRADAQTHAFPPAGADLVFSRFGVMFFNDPVAAMSNLRRSTKPKGRLAMICWQGAPENPWFILSMKAAVTRLGPAEPLDPLAPGPMAFKDIDRVTGILAEAGWGNPQGTPMEVDLHPPQSLDEAASFATTVGPATRLIRERNASEEDIAAIRDTCVQSFAQYQSDAGLRIPARVIVYTAQNTGE